MFKRNPDAAAAAPLKIERKKKESPPPAAPTNGGNLFEQIPKRASQRRSRVNPDSDSLKKAGITPSALTKEMEALAKDSQQAPMPPASPPPPLPSSPPVIDPEVRKPGGIAALNEKLRNRAKKGVKSRTGTIQRTVRAQKTMQKRDTSEEKQPAPLSKDSVQNLRMSIGSKLGLLPAGSRCCDEKQTWQAQRCRQKCSWCKTWPFTEATSRARARDGKSGVSKAVRSARRALTSAFAKKSGSSVRTPKAKPESIERSAALDGLLTRAFAKKSEGSLAPTKPKSLERSSALDGLLTSAFAKKMGGSPAPPTFKEKATIQPPAAPSMEIIGSEPSFMPPATCAIHGRDGHSSPACSAYGGRFHSASSSAPDGRG